MSCALRVGRNGCRGCPRDPRRADPSRPWTGSRRAARTALRFATESRHMICERPRPRGAVVGACARRPDGCAAPASARRALRGRDTPPHTHQGRRRRYRGRARGRISHCSMYMADRSRERDFKRLRTSPASPDCRILSCLSGHQQSILAAKAQIKHIESSSSNGRVRGGSEARAGSFRGILVGTNT